MSIISKLEKQELQFLCDSSNSYAHIMDKLNLPIQGATYRELKRRIHILGVSESKLTDNRNQHLSAHMKTLSSANAICLKDILGNKVKAGRKSVKTRLLKEGLLEERCSLCGQDPFWNGRKLVLVLDHINGVNNDNSLDNLRLLCPNCNSQTETFCGRNTKKNKYVCSSCGGIRKYKASQNCEKCAKKKPRRKKIDWPPDEELLLSIKETSLSAASRKLGVSTAAIKKHLANR